MILNGLLDPSDVLLLAANLAGAGFEVLAVVFLKGLELADGFF